VDSRDSDAAIWDGDGIAGYTRLKPVGRDKIDQAGSPVGIEEIVANSLFAALFLWRTCPSRGERWIGRFPGRYAAGVAAAGPGDAAEAVPDFARGQSKEEQEIGVFSRA